MVLLRFVQQGSLLTKDYKTAMKFQGIYNMQKERFRSQHGRYIYFDFRSQIMLFILCMATDNLKEGKSKLTARDWNRQADKKHLIKIYQKWSFDWLDVPRMIAGAEAVYEFPMSDRNPLPRWTFDRVTLLGDAAHPMYPIGSNGASQAILDAEYLANCLTENTDISEALMAYNNERLPATSRVVLQNRAKGPDEIMDLMEERFPAGFKTEEIPVQELADIMDHYKKVAGFEIRSLNQKAVDIS